MTVGQLLVFIFEHTGHDLTDILGFPRGEITAWAKADNEDFLGEVLGLLSEEQTKEAVDVLQDTIKTLNAPWV